MPKIVKKVLLFHTAEKLKDLVFLKGKKYQKAFGISWVIYKTLKGKRFLI